MYFNKPIESCILGMVSHVLSFDFKDIYQLQAKVID